MYRCDRLRCYCIWLCTIAATHDQGECNFMHLNSCNRFEPYELGRRCRSTSSQARSEPPLPPSAASTMEASRGPVVSDTWPCSVAFSYSTCIAYLSPIRHVVLDTWSCLVAFDYNTCVAYPSSTNLFLHMQQMQSIWSEAEAVGGERGPYPSYGSAPSTSCSGD